MPKALSSAAARWIFKTIWGILKILSSDNKKVLGILVMYDAHDKRLWGNGLAVEFFHRARIGVEETPSGKISRCARALPFLFHQGQNVHKGCRCHQMQGSREHPPGFFAGLPDGCIFLLCHIFPNTFIINSKKFFMFGESIEYLKHAFDREDAAIVPARNFH